MVASSQFCQVIRLKPETLWQRYKLSALEYRRLSEMAHDPGIVCSGTLYRANRFAPIVLNLPLLSRALGTDLRSKLEKYWAASPHTNVNFLLECERFLTFLTEEERRGWQMSLAVKQAFDREHRDLKLRLMANSTVL